MSERTPRANQNYHEITFRTDWLKYRGEKYHQYRRDWAEYPRRREFPPFPLHVDIETTTRCNLRCPMCARTRLLKKGEFTDNLDLTWDDYTRIMDQVGDMGSYALKLANLGEPLIHPDIIRQVKYAKDRGVIDLLMNSNGALLTPEMSGEIMEAGLDKMLVSFDSPYPEEYEKIRVGGRFSKTFENVKKFSELRDKRFPHVFIRVSMVLFDWSDKTRQKIKDMAELFAPYVDAIGMTDYVDFLDDSEKPVYPDFFCGQLTQRLIFLIGGKMVMCCTDDKAECPVGDWRTDKVRDVWSGRKLGGIREMHQKGEYHKIDICRRCIKPHQEFMSSREEEKAGGADGVFADFKDQLKRE